MNVILLLYEWNEAVQIPEWKYPVSFSLYPCTVSSFLNVYGWNVVRPMACIRSCYVLTRNKGRKRTGRNYAALPVLRQPPTFTNRHTVISPCRSC